MMHGDSKFTRDSQLVVPSLLRREEGRANVEGTLVRLPFRKMIDSDTILPIATMQSSQHGFD